MLSVSLPMAPSYFIHLQRVCTGPLHAAWVPAAPAAVSRLALYTAVLLPLVNPAAKARIDAALHYYCENMVRRAENSCCRRARAARRAIVRGEQAAWFDLYLYGHVADTHASSSDPQLRRPQVPSV